MWNVAVSTRPLPNRHGRLVSGPRVQPLFLGYPNPPKLELERPQCQLTIAPKVTILPNCPRKPLQSVPGVIRLLLVTMMAFPQALMPRGDRKNKFFSGTNFEDDPSSFSQGLDYHVVNGNVHFDQILC